MARRLWGRLGRQLRVCGAGCWRGDDTDGAVLVTGERVCVLAVRFEREQVLAVDVDGRHILVADCGDLSVNWAVRRDFGSFLLNSAKELKGSWRRARNARNVEGFEGVFESVIQLLKGYKANPKPSFVLYRAV